jgi:tetratricopeptide (TPR) repeat protein
MLEKLKEKFQQSHFHFVNGPATQCEALLRECLAGYGEQLGNTHPQTLQIGHLLTQVLNYQKRYHEAFQIKNLQIETLNADPQAPPEQMFFCIRQLIEIARDAEQFEPAMSICKQAVTRYQGKHIESHAFLVLLAGTIAQAMEEYDKAFAHYAEVRTVLERDQANDHILSGFTQFYLGTLERDRDQDKLALQHFERTAEILQGLGEGADQELFAHNQFQLALLRTEGREPQQVIGNLLACLETHAKVFGPRVPLTAKIHSSLGYHYNHGLADKESAQKHYQMARDIYTQWLGADSVEVAGLNSLLELLAPKG